jgi:hypothetical protein
MPHAPRVCLVAALLLASCTSNERAGDTSAPPEPSSSSSSTGSTIDDPNPEGTSPSATAPTTDSTPTTDASTPSADGALIDRGALPAGECGLGAPPSSGEITFVADGVLYGYDGTTVRCLSRLDGEEPTWLSWSPDGDEVLTGPDVVIRNDALVTATGYFADNTSVRWSAPSGKALIAPRKDTGELVWRNAHDADDRLDISFATGITAAAYHPAGKHIAAAGIGLDGAGAGLFIASNRGEEPVRVGTLEDGVLSELQFDMDGRSMVFVHLHTDGPNHVHRYDQTADRIDTLAEPTATPTDLVASTAELGNVAWAETGDDGRTVTQVHVAGATAAVTVDLDAASARPLGWLPGQRLLLAVDTDDDRIDVWEWSSDGVRLVVTDVSSAAPRVIAGPYEDFVVTPGAEFG